MLQENEFVFKKITEDDLNYNNTFVIYGDNLLEAIDIVNFLYDANKDKMASFGIKYLSLSEFVYMFMVNGEMYYFICKPYYHQGNIPPSVRHLMTNIDKPDAILYSKKDDRVIMGFESTLTTFAGNATWQRMGRTIHFLQKNVPFAFLGYSCKLDQSNKINNSKPRTPSGLFVLSYMALSLKYKAPALVGFYKHDDPAQSLNIETIDMKDDVFKYLFSLLFDKDGINDTLKKCFENMCAYYSTNVVSNNEFSPTLRSKISDKNFAKEIINSFSNINHTTPLFSENDVKFFEWKPKNLTDKIHSLFPNVSFFQLSKNCKAGICFDTGALISKLDEKNNIYSDVYLSRQNEPTIMIPIKLTKMDKGRRIFTDDPYNGEISAFSEIYKQSFPNANIMIILTDHTHLNEYEVSDPNGRKIYRSISKYADILIDLDLHIFDNYSVRSSQVPQSTFANIRITEDPITCFFYTVLRQEEIEVSYINPPGSSWSDMKLYPTNKFYYYKRNDQRADIAYYYSGVYYIGESKDKYPTLASTIDNEYNKVMTILKIIKENIQTEINIEYKTFCIFYGSLSEAKKALDSSRFDYAAVISETLDYIKLNICSR